MTMYRNQLPQLDETRFLTDGGLETTLIFENNIELQEFAAFTLLQDSKSRQELTNYYQPYIQLAKEKNLGFVLESPTWRASKDWGKKLGKGPEALEQLNTLAIELLVEIRQKNAHPQTPMVISGCIGPRGDGYKAEKKMSIAEARRYHTEQINTFAKTQADLVSAFTITYTEEAIGITLAAEDNNIPAVISFTVETDGRLPSGQPLGAAIEEVDEVTSNGPVYYMVNCAHPSHFADVLASGGKWMERIKGIRANASCKSHEELDESVELDRGNPEEFADDYRNLESLLPDLMVIGGCCGTDLQHLEAICELIPT